MKSKGFVMTKAEQFRKAVKKTQQQTLSMQQEADYMSDMSHWCAVHVTDYMPRENSDGTKCILSRAMSSDFDIPRTTIHVALNHIVASHMYGSWNDKEIVVLAPYNDIVKQNGNPVEISGADTYWSANPDVGLVLPKSAYVISPDNDGPLYKIGKNYATYKRDKYSDKEIKTIVSMLSPSQKDQYNKYVKGDVDESVLKQVFLHDKRIQKMYTSAKDKKAFLRGLFEESRFDILSQYLRDAVVGLVMDKAGFKYIDSVIDGGKTSEAIAMAASAKGISATASDKGHDSSVYAALEHYYRSMILFLRYNELDETPGILRTTDFKAIYDLITTSRRVNAVEQGVLFDLVGIKSINFMQIYQDEYKSDVQRKLTHYGTNLKMAQHDLDGAIHSPYLDDVEKAHYTKEHQKSISIAEAKLKFWSSKKTISSYDKNLDVTIRRHCKKLSAEYKSWRDKISKMRGYEQFLRRLRNWYSAHYVMDHGRDDF